MESGGHNGIRTDSELFFGWFSLLLFYVWKLWKRSCELCHFVFGSSLNAVVDWICDFMRHRIWDKKSSTGKKSQVRWLKSVTAGLSLRGPHWWSEWVRWACHMPNIEVAVACDRWARTYSPANSHSQNLVFSYKIKSTVRFKTKTLIFVLFFMSVSLRTCRPNVFWRRLILLTSF